jgi:hypothetical protein
MGRIARAVAPEWPHYVTQRGNRRMPNQGIGTRDRGIKYGVPGMIVSDSCPPAGRRVGEKQNKRGLSLLIAPLAWMGGWLGFQVGLASPAAEGRKHETEQVGLEGKPQGWYGD